MLQTLRNAWKIPELRKKLIYTVLLLVIFRLGSYIPVPGLREEAIKEFMGGFGAGMQGLLNNFSGGALERGSIFAMSISPYINASIIMQLLSVAIPALERLSKEGEEGRKKIASYTRVVTVVLGLLQAVGLYFGLKSGIAFPGFMGAVITITSLTAGTAFLMWLGEQITEKGVGNGISLLIFAGIVSRGPAMIKSLYVSVFAAEGGVSIPGVVSLVAIVVVAVLAIAFVVMMNEAERRIPVQYAKRVVGRKMYGGQSTHIPIKVSMAGVMPIIFAVSIMSFPQTISMFVNGANTPTTGFWGLILRWFTETHPFYIIVYFLLILFFTYFYTSIQFNPIEVSNNIQKNGGFVPGIRPGKNTSDYVAKIVSRITLVGALFLAVIAIFPILLSFTGIQGVSIGGTSLLIMVGVALETVKQIESQMLMRHYKGFLE